MAYTRMLQAVTRVINTAQAIMGGMGKAHPAKMAVLFVLPENNTVPYTQIKRQLSSFPDSLISRHCVELFKAGFVDRAYDPNDLRLAEYRLTQKGREARRQIAAASGLPTAHTE